MGNETIVSTSKSAAECNQASMSGIIDKMALKRCAIP